MATENNAVNTAGGGVVKPIYADREMKCLIVSESELKQIGLANLGVTVFAAIGSALMSFSVDIFKDTVFSPPAPATVQMASMIDKLSFWSAIVCYGVAAALWIWRHDMIGTIRKESAGSSQSENP